MAALFCFRMGIFPMVHQPNNSILNGLLILIMFFGQSSMRVFINLDRSSFTHWYQIPQLHLSVINSPTNSLITLSLSYKQNACTVHEVDTGFSFGQDMTDLTVPTWLASIGWYGVAEVQTIIPPTSIGGLVSIGLHPFHFPLPIFSAQPIPAGSTPLVHFDCGFSFPSGSHPYIVVPYI